MIKKFNSIQYDLVDKYLMHDFTDDIYKIIRKKKIILFLTLDVIEENFPPK